MNFPLEIPGDTGRAICCALIIVSEIASWVGYFRFTRYVGDTEYRETPHLLVLQQCFMFILILVTLIILFQNRDPVLLFIFLTTTVALGFSFLALVLFRVGISMPKKRHHRGLDWSITWKGLKATENTSSEYWGRKKGKHHKTNRYSGYFK